jgi:hypothetical protein
MKESHNKAMQLNAKSAVSFSSFVVYENNLYNSIAGETNFLHQLIAGRYVH